MISSAENLARKKEIRERIDRLTRVTARFSEEGLKELISDVPAIVWIYIVDTDEEAGVEVLQEVVLELATREDDDASRIRENVIVILTPLTNPDSHARYVTWHRLYNVAGASLDPNAIENRAHWGMNTDGNAYGIDVNRDFSFLVSPEIRALSQVAMKCRPQFFLDIHSGPNVLFMTPYPPPYHPLWTGRQRKWWDAVARRANENFGPKGWSFSSRAGYAGPGHIGFSDTWGMLGPAVTGFLYETFGGRPGETIAFRPERRDYCHDANGNGSAPPGYLVGAPSCARPAGGASCGCPLSGCGVGGSSPLKPSPGYRTACCWPGG
jgi:hypothetical protein